MESSDSDTDLICAISCVAIQLKTIRRRKRRKLYHINPYLQLRCFKGRFYKDFEDMRATPHIFHENFHMAPEQFDELLGLIQQRLEPRVRTRPMDSISPQEKLAVTLEFLASGSLQRHIASTYRISKQRLGPIIEDTCKIIFEELRGLVMKPPSKNEWIDISNEFNSTWNFPNTVGAVDGKHVAIKCPINAGSVFYNYKGFHSIVLMGIAGPKYQFIFIDVGGYGSESDSQVFRSCDFGRSLWSDQLDFPPDANLHGKKTPFFIVADDAFPLIRRIMKPFCPARKGAQLSDQQRIFNYRLSRARRCVENAFGIMCARWICLARTLFAKPERAQIIIAACCMLHNFLLAKSSDSYCPPGFADIVNTAGDIVEGSWRQRIPLNSMFNSNVPRQIQTPNAKVGNEIREHVLAFVNSVQGALDWQRQSVFLDD